MSVAVMSTLCPSYSFPLCSPLFSLSLLFCPPDSSFCLLEQSCWVLTALSINPKQWELEAIQDHSLESSLGDFQHCSPSFTPSLWVWELAAQEGYCWREINHTWQLLWHTHTHIMKRAKTQDTYYLNITALQLLFNTSEDVSWYQEDYSLTLQSHRVSYEYSIRFSNVHVCHLKSRAFIHFVSHLILWKHRFLWVLMEIFIIF